jgi:hypothetical protein
MKTQGVTPALVALLQGPAPVLAADLYQFTLASGQLLCYGTADVAIVYGGNSYGGSVRFDRSQISLKAGLETDTLSVKCYATSDDLVNGVPFHQWLRQGGLDNADLLLRRAFFPLPAGWFAGGWMNPPGWLGGPLTAPAGVIWLFDGLVTQVVTGGLQAEIKIDSHLYCLDRKIPRNIYQHLCNHTPELAVPQPGQYLYGSGCGLLAAAYAAPGLVAAGSTIFQLNTNLTGRAAGYFSLGKLQFTSGGLQGTWAGIQAQVGSGSGPISLTLIPPLLGVPAVGDAFTAWPGCDRSLATCINKFNNALNFRGFPWIPVPETAT